MKMGGADTRSAAVIEAENKRSQGGMMDIDKELDKWIVDIENEGGADGYHVHPEAALELYDLLKAVKRRSEDDKIIADDAALERLEQSRFISVGVNVSQTSS